MSGRELIKVVFRIAANVAALPFLLYHVGAAAILGKDRALESSSQLLSLLPGLCGQYVRRAFLAWTIDECHPSATICFGVLFSTTATRIGAKVYIGPYCTFGWVSIEKDVLIGSGVHFTSGSRIHGIADPTRPIRDQPGEPIQVTLGAGCWIGNGAIVMADVGANSVIGAGAVVTKPIPESVIAAGVPARVIRSRFSESADPPKE